MKTALLLPRLAARSPSSDTGPMDTSTVTAGQEALMPLDWTDGSASIDAGWMVTFSLELLPCQASAGLFLISTARAESLTERTQSQPDI